MKNKIHVSLSTISFFEAGIQSTSVTIKHLTFLERQNKTKRLTKFQNIFGFKNVQIFKGFLKQKIIFAVIIFSLFHTFELKTSLLQYYN